MGRDDSLQGRHQDSCLRLRHLFCSLQVNVDNIDSDLFGRNVKGAMYQPVDETLVKYKKAAYDIVRAAYDDNVVSPPSIFSSSVVAA